MENKFEQIREWATERGIYDKGDVKTQYVKLQEEAGELAKAIMKNDLDEFIDAIGDCVVVLTNLAELGNKHFELDKRKFNIEIEGCIDSAWDEIKDRKGKMVNGTFVKQTKKNYKLKQHRNGYYNLPCKFTDLLSFMELNTLEIEGRIYSDKDSLHLRAKPSRSGGCAYIYKSDLDEIQTK